METEWLITVTGRLGDFSHSLYSGSSSASNLGGTWLCPLKRQFTTPKVMEIYRVPQNYRAKGTDVPRGRFICRQHVLPAHNSQQLRRTKVWRDTSLKPPVKTKGCWDSLQVCGWFALRFRGKHGHGHCQTRDLDCNAGGIPWSAESEYAVSEF